MINNLKTVLAFTIFLGALSSSSSQADENSINLKECEPLYKFADALKETGEVAEKWEKESKITKEKHQKFVTSCKESKESPNQTELLKEFRKSAKEYSEEAHKFSSTTKNFKEKLRVSFDGLVKLKSRKCAEQVDYANKVVSIEANKEISKLDKICSEFDGGKTI